MERSSGIADSGGFIPIRGIPLLKIAINLNPASMIRVASSRTLKMMITVNVNVHRPS